MPTETQLQAGRPVSPTLAERWRGDLLKKRLLQEARKREDEVPVLFPLNLFKKLPYYHGLKTFLKFSGLYDRGRRNYLNPQTVLNKVYLERLPAAFNGMRILQLTDIHLDLDPDLLGVIQKCIARLDYDVCVITGDFRDSLLPVGVKGIELSAQLVQFISKPVYGCLGNHDIAADVEPLEAAGIRMLVNEAVLLEAKDAQLAFVGIDDAGYMGSDDLDTALEEVPDDVCKVLLSHAPDAYEKAAGRNVDFMLSGHTHGGQICLPGGRALMSHSDCPRSMIGGAWSYQRLQGYTSRGTGACRVPVRFHCPGEIVLHTLLLPPA